MPQPESFINEHGERVIKMLGVTVVFKTASEATDGRLAVLEYTAPPHFAGPHPHWHKIATEAFYIVEGELQLKRGDETVQAGPGDFVLIPPGTIHSFSNQTAEPVKFLVTLTPAGVESYFFALAELVRHEATWPPADMGKVMTLAEQFDTYAPPATAAG
jgi:mannose-6-phosphate isomerase-like protein (cupin superfamily)